MTTPRVVITRAEDDAARWQARLAQHGIGCDWVPLLRLQTLTPDPSWQRWWSAVRANDAVFFVSAQAVRGAVAALGSVRWAQLLQRWQGGQGPRCWVPGPGTAQALHQAGVPMGVVDGPAPNDGALDSEHLWDQVQPQVHAGMRLMVARGRAEYSDKAQGEGRDWLAQRCARAGVEITAVALYERGPPQWTPAALEAWRRVCADTQAIWLVSSTQALQHAASVAPAATWWGAARLLATHDRVARAALTMGWGQVKLCGGREHEVVAAVNAWDDLPTIYA